MKRNRTFGMERLEDRQLMAGDLATTAVGSIGDLLLDRGTSMVPAVPAYSSNPGAPATLYLDFNGHFEASWGNYSNVTTPVYSIDGDTTTFSPTELATIKAVWQHVAEDFAPFNINVTTVNPGNFANGKALRAAIGGTTLDWYREGIILGIAGQNSFSNSAPNTVYAFAQYNSNARLIADTVSQEAGHSFGLHHQSLVDANGVLVAEYSPGTSAKSPIMGYNIDSVRSTWWNGTTSRHLFDTYMVQDDMAVIASATNGFGYRGDDHGSTWQTALPMGQFSSYGPVASQYGIIGTTSDTDWFQFNVMTNGRLSLQAEVAQVGANLDARLSLFRLEHRLGSDGKVIYSMIRVATADPTTSLNASLAANLTPGNYFAVVGSHGEYGDVGQYTLKGSFSAPLSRDILNNVVNQPLTATRSLSITAASETTVATTLNSAATVQRLAVPPASQNTSYASQSASSLTSPMNRRTAAIDEALTSSVSLRRSRISDDLLSLIAAG